MIGNKLFAGKVLIASRADGRNSLNFANCAGQNGRRFVRFPGGGVLGTRRIGASAGSLPGPILVRFGFSGDGAGGVILGAILTFVPNPLS
jgi:hypothetical protein